MLNEYVWLPSLIGRVVSRSVQWSLRLVGVQFELNVDGRVVAIRPGEGDQVSASRGMFWGRLTYPGGSLGGLLNHQVSGLNEAIADVVLAQEREITAKRLQDEKNRKLEEAARERERVERYLNVYTQIRGWVLQVEQRLLDSQQERRWVTHEQQVALWSARPQISVQDHELDALFSDQSLAEATGASSGLGACSARHLSSLGARLVLGARRVGRIREVADELIKNGGDAIAVPTDVTNFEDVKNLVDRAVEAFGRVDVVINNAGLMPHSRLNRIKVSDWSNAIDVNIKGVLHGIGAALPHMERQKAGHIINVSSVAGRKVRPGNAVYAATKSAVLIITEGLRQEVKPYDIRTTVISPGAVDTELPGSITEQDIERGVRQYYEEYAIAPESFARAVAFAINQPRDVDVNEIVFRPTRQEL